MRAATRTVEINQRILPIRIAAVCLAGAAGAA